MDDRPNLLRVSEEGYVEGAIGLEFFVVVGRVCVRTQNRCPQDQLRVNGGICRINLPKGGVINRVSHLEYATNDIGEGYASYPTHAGQGSPCLVEGLGGQGHVEGLSRIVRLLVAKVPFVHELLLGL